jgi:hypothetical protein
MHIVSSQPVQLTTRNTSIEPTQQRNIIPCWERARCLVVITGDLIFWYYTTSRWLEGLLLRRQFSWWPWRFWPSLAWRGHWKATSGRRPGRRSYRTKASCSFSGKCTCRSWGLDPRAVPIAHMVAAHATHDLWNILVAWIIDRKSEEPTKHSPGVPHRDHRSDAGFGGC